MSEKKSKRDWKNMSNDKLKEYCNDNYAGMSRNEVQKIDGSFYQVIGNRGLLNELIESKIKPRREWKSMSNDELKEYYHENYAGMSRSEVAKADSSFYMIVIEKKLFDEGLTESKHRDWQSKSDEELKQHYHDNYSGMNRSEVQKIDGSFYQVIGNRGLLDELIERKLIDWEGMSDEKLEEHCQENYSGMSRSEVQRECKGFYNIILKREIADKLIPPTRKPNGYYQDIDNIQIELEIIIKQLDGKFPRVKDIKKISTGLLTGIYDYHGSLTTVKIQLGYADKEMEVLKEILEELRDE